MEFNVLSLFDGMSCAQIALERCGIKYDRYFASEIDKHAIKVTQHNYPKTIQLGDVTKISSESLPKIKLLIGGSPCQGFSFAGKQLNFEDPRSKLFFEFVRLKNELQPEYFLLENVMMKQEFQDVISELLGVSPIQMCSSLVSAQRRNRLYWTNIPYVFHPIDRGIMLKDIIENGDVDSSKSFCIDANYHKGSNLRQYIEKHRRQIVFKDKSHTLRVGGRGSPPDSKQNLDNALDSKIEYRKLTVKECERLQTVPDGYTSCVSNSQAYKMLGNGFTVDVIVHILSGLKQQEGYQMGFIDV